MTRLQDMVKVGGWVKCIHPSDYGLEEGNLYRVVYRGSETGSPTEDRVMFYKVEGTNYEWFHDRFVPAKWHEILAQKVTDWLVRPDWVLGGKP